MRTLLNWSAWGKVGGEFVSRNQFIKTDNTGEIYFALGIREVGEATAVYWQNIFDRLKP